MRVSCGCPKDTASKELLSKICALGLDPIVTNTTIRCVYEGENKTIGESVVRIFSREEGHDVTVLYDKGEIEVDPQPPEVIGKHAKRKTRHRKH